jgi:hypothetical protein
MWALGQVFVSQYFGFPLSVSFHQCKILVQSPIKITLLNNTTVKNQLTKRLMCDPLPSIPAFDKKNKLLCTSFSAFYISGPIMTL